MNQIGGTILPSLNQQGAGMAIKPEAPAVLATQLIESMGLDSNDYLEDYTQGDFREKAAQVLEKQSKDKQAQEMIEQRKREADAALAEANVRFTDAQSRNTMDDNAKQLAVSIDKHFQEWADLTIKSVKEGAEIPPHPEYGQIIMMARQILQPQQQQEEGMMQQDGQVS